MGRINRREAITIMGAATGMLVCPLPAWSNPRPDPSIETLAKRIGSVSQAEVFDLAVKLIGEGVTYRDMLTAICLAGLRDIRPRHVGGKLHAVIMVASVLELAEQSDSKRAWQLTLWNLADLKRSQEMDRERGDWHLGPQPDPGWSHDKAKAELDAAMNDWDDERADRAIVGLLPHLDHEQMYEVLWPLAARCYVNIGHKIIYASQLERTLRRIGWQHAQPALRSLIHGLLFVGGSGPQMEAMARSRQLLSALPAGWLAGRADSAQSLAILKQLRQVSSPEAQDLVVAALTDGLAPESIWDGLRLYASELFLHRHETDTPAHREALLPVHAVTVTHALGHAWRCSKSETTRKLMLLQAAAYLPLLRRDLRNIVGLRDDAEGLDVLGNSVPVSNASLHEAFPTLTPAKAQAMLNANPRQSPALMKHMREALISGGLEHHQHKLAAAIQEECTRVQPVFSTRILSPAVGYLVDTGKPNERLQRIDYALKKAGIHD